MAEQLVSVIIPAWNVGKLLPRCLDSVLAQTHRRFEIIVVDDGSTDDTAEVMRRYEQRHAEVHTITQRHRGLGPARNAALSVCRGEFISMVDADDWVAPTFLADLVALAQRTGADVAVGGFSFDAIGLSVPFPFLPRVRTMSGMEAAQLSIHLTRFPSFAWNKLYRRHLFHADDAAFPSIYYEDLATTPRILRRAGTVALTRRVYYHYCLRGDGITGAFGIKNVLSFAAAINFLRRDLWQEGLWRSWQPSYRRLLVQAKVMMTAQTLLQRNHIPLRARVPLLARYYRLLRGLTGPPGDGEHLHFTPLRTTAARPSFGRRVVSHTLTIARPGTPRPHSPRSPSPSA